MSKVICFGEALIDFLCTSSDKAENLTIKQFDQYPGGAPANAAVAVAKLGGKAAFVGQVGDDMFGHFLIDALDQYQVNTEQVALHPTAKTALAFVSLDESGERSFSFYRQATADILYQASQCPAATLRDADILHFCSNTLTDPAISANTQELLRNATEQNLLISFDVNLRHSLWPSLCADKEIVNAFVDMAHILKFSFEELSYLTDDISAYIKRLLSHKAMLIVVTRDGDPIDYYSEQFHGQIQAPKVNVVDTTAAGDGFVGGLLFKLTEDIRLTDALKHKNRIEEVISFAAHCGAYAVTRSGAFPSLPKLADIESFIASTEN